MGLELEYINGQTLLDEDEKAGLKIQTITTRKELDEFEQFNIQKAVEWSLSRKLKIRTILTEKFIKDLHKRMFFEVWEWAGEFRKSNKNIGVDKFLIGVELKNLIDDCNYWITNKTFSKDEIAVRFSHRIVKIHLFSNGNGRHSRLIADILINRGFEEEIFSWGSTNLTNKSEVRSRYLDALHNADNNDYSLLLKFARE
ncbi:MAG: mobile mystery protein B [Ignavibacteriaceae bacterium]|jgi:Fic-DOC domain mobile mystery protein B